MEVSNHCGRRYVERIKGIETKASGPYYIQNSERINKEILKLYQHAEMFFSGKVKIHPNRQYLKHQTIIIVADNDEIITLFKVKFGSLSEDRIIEVLDIMMDDLQKKLSERVVAQDKVKNDIQIFNGEISCSKAKIAQLKSEMEIEQHHINANTELKKASQKEVTQLDYVIHDMFEAIIGKGFASEL